MNKNQQIKKYLENVFYSGVFIDDSERGLAVTDKYIDEFYECMNIMSKEQIIELIWLWFSHIECNNSFDEYEELIEEFIENNLED